MVIEGQKTSTCIWILLNTYLHSRTIHRVHTLVDFPSPIHKVIADRLSFGIEASRQLFDSLKGTGHGLWQCWSVGILVLIQCSQRRHLSIHSFIEQVCHLASWLLTLEDFTLDKYLRLTVVLLGRRLSCVPSVQLRVYSDVVVDPSLELEFLFWLLNLKTLVSASWTFFQSLFFPVLCAFDLILYFYFLQALFLISEFSLPLNDLFITVDSSIWIKRFECGWWQLATGSKPIYIAFPRLLSREQFAHQLWVESITVFSLFLRLFNVVWIACFI